jgi:uncharacterized protein (TIGR00252 family)
MGQTTKEKLGRKGEKLALQHLKKLGYRTVTRNYRTTMGEIDLIMQEGDSLIFVEVKTRQDESFAKAEDAINFRKQKKFRRPHVISLRPINCSNAPADLIRLRSSWAKKPNRSSAIT